MSSPIVGATGSGNTAPSSSGTSAAPPVDPLAQENTFLTLLVTQLKNQDPENPSDPTKMVTELAQFSQLEQSVQINSNVSAIEQAVVPAAGSGATAQTAGA
jgi:flagellar basal-body rod modification protein FlgD